MPPENGHFAAQIEVVAGRSERQLAEVFAKNGRLIVNGRTVHFTYAYPQQRDREADESNSIVLLDSHLKPTLQVPFATNTEAMAFFALLGVGECKKPIKVTPGFAQFFVLKIIIHLIVAAMFGALFSRLHTLFFPAAFVYVVFHHIFHRRRKITFDLDGITIVRGFERRSVAWANVTRVERMFHDGLRLCLLSTPAHPFDIVGLDTCQTEGFFLIIQDFRTVASRRNNGDDAPKQLGSADEKTVPASSLLAMGSREPEDWFTAIGQLVPREG